MTVVKLNLTPLGQEYQRLNDHHQGVKNTIEYCSDKDIVVTGKKDYPEYSNDASLSFEIDFRKKDDHKSKCNKITLYDFPKEMLKDLIQLTEKFIADNFIAMIQPEYVRSKEALTNKLLEISNFVEQENKSLK